MKAKDAKELANKNKKQVAENLEIKKNKATSADVTLLYTHIQEKVEDAVKAGKLSINGIEFLKDRFNAEVIQTVVDKLKEDGYNISMEQHNAYQKISFNVSWAA